MELKIKHDQNHQRFYVIKDNETCELKYKKLDEQTLDYYSTFVPESLRHEGIAAKITDYALRYAKAHHYQVVPSCPYVQKYMDKHPEYQPLVKKRAKNKSSEFPLQKYWPLICLILISYLSALSINWQVGGSTHNLMHYFMGIFLVFFSTLKLFHPIDFADGFSKYDLIAQRYRIYAYCYPVIELLLGLAYLSFFLPILTYLFTIIILTIGAVGVIKGLQQGLDINCPCMGTVLDVPLSTVTLIEDIGMALMALGMLIRVF